MSESIVPQHAPSHAGEGWFTNRNLDETFHYKLKRDEEVLWTYENARGSDGYRFLNWLGLVWFLVLPIWIWSGWVQEFSFQALMRAANSSVFWVLSIIYFIFGGIGLIRGFLRVNRFAYAVTDRRVFVMNSLSPMVIDEYQPADLKNIVTFGSDELGTVVIDQWPWVPFLPRIPRRLSNIPEPHKVRALIEERLLKSASERTAA